MSDIYLVVSDVHLGGEGNYEPNLPEFCDFLEWVRDLPPEGKTITTPCKEGGNKTITIRPPTKLILLGDIMELWGPREQDRNSVIADSIKPFSLLHDINCDKIYITGNHDENIEEVAEKVKFFDWKDKNNFILYSRHYPPNDEVKKGIKINGLRYSFLHGHQYDKEQITYTLSKILNTRFDPIDFFQDLANVSFTKKFSSNVSIALLILWFALILLKTFFSNSILINGIGMVFGGLVAILLIHYYQSSQKIIRERNVSNWFAYLFIFSFAGMISILAAGIIYHQIYSFLFSASLFIITYLILLSIIPKIVTSSMRSFYNKFRTSKDKTSEEIVKENYFNLKRDTIDANVVVFGHTHKASSYIPSTKELKKQKLFINSGSWIKETGGDANTFVYIDPEGVYLLKWAGSSRIECISHCSTLILRALRASDENKAT